jgi:diguanylate cyclase (GGDEF)-like protein/PAS domain S-box-containing protein
MDHHGTVAPAGARPRPPARGVEFALDSRVASSRSWFIWPIAATATGVTVLVLGVTVMPLILRLAVGGLVVAVSLRQAYRFRERNRLVESERSAAARMVETEAWRRLVIERLPAAVYVDRYRRADGGFLESVYMSPRMEELTGYPIDSFRVDAELWPMMVHPDDRERFRAFDIPGYLSGDTFEEEYRIVRADGRVLWVREEAHVFESTDPDTILCHGFVVDITDRKELEQQLNQLAFHDPLTGLANRALFGDRLEHAFAGSARSGLYPGVLFLDLDDLKEINDNLGHGAGDRLLQVVGERLRAAVRPTDCVARLGGDEFAVLLEDVSGPTVAIAAADRLLDLLRKPVEIDGHQRIALASIGIAVAGAHSVSPDGLLRDADAAMYRAKASGRNRWVLFEPEIRADALAV